MSKTIEDILEGVANEYSAGGCYEHAQPLMVDQALKEIEAIMLERVIGSFTPQTRGVTQNPNNAAYWTKASKAVCEKLEEQRQALQAAVYGGEDD